MAGKRHFDIDSSFLKIEGSISSTTTSSYRKAAVEEMLEQLKNSDPKTTSPQESIPPKLLKTNADLFFPPVELFSKWIQKDSFPNDLKRTDASSKGDTMCKENYRPTSLLPAVSKLFGRLLYTQLYDTI